MTNETDGTEGARLEALFQEARRVRPGPDLTARVLADARAVQEAARPAPLWRRRLRRPPGIVAALGGWGAIGGVTAAGLAGLGVGFWAPGTLDTLSGGWLTPVSGTSFTPDLSALALEFDDV